MKKVLTVPAANVDVEARLSLCNVRSNYRGNVGWVFGIVILTEWPSVTKLESPISVTDAEDFIFFTWSWFANWDVIRCSWEPESSRARQGTKTPERFFTKTLAVAKSTISLLNSCAIRQCRGNLCSFLWRKGRWVSQVKQSVVLRSACTTTTGVALPNLMTNLKTISQETGF